MKEIILIKSNEEVKRFRIREAFMIDGFRILVDYINESRPTGSFKNMDGSDDEVFKTEDEALNRAIRYVNSALKVKQIDSYIVKEV